MLLVAASSLLLSLWSCRIDDDNSQPQRDIYRFAEKVKIDPVKKEYNIGDIFWLEVNFPGKELTTVDTGEDIFIGNATFFITVNAEVLTAEPVPQSDTRFDAAQQSGEIIKGDDFDTNAEATLSFGCPEATYFLRAGLQLKEKGNYVLFLNQEDGLSYIAFTEDTDCSLQDIFPPPPEADLGYVQFTFDVEDTNLDVFNDVVGADNQSPLLNEFRAALENKTAFFLAVR